MAYFDNAATTYPKPEIVYQSMDQFQRHTGGSFGRGNYGFSSSAKSIVDDTSSRPMTKRTKPASAIPSRSWSAVRCPRTRDGDL